ncbi:MAG: TonB-dependent siderophore receptor [Maricaulaceae bacterium]
MITRPNRRSGWFLCASALVLCASQAQAQTQGAQTETVTEADAEVIIVEGAALDLREGSGVGTRLNTPIEDQPLSIQILGEDVLDQIGGARLDDVIDFAVGGVQGNQFGGSSENFLFRGFAASVADDGVLQNGVVAFSPRRRDASSIERTEILRGPSSALFGQGGPGGVVNVVRKRPVLGETFAGFAVEGSSLIRTRGEFDLNTPLTDELAVRLITAVEGGNSFRFQDAFEETFPENRVFVSPSVLWAPNEATSVLLRGEYLRTENPFDRGILFDLDGNVVGERGDFFGDPTVGPIVNEDISGFLEIAHAFNETWSTRVTASVIANDFDGPATEPVLIFPEPLLVPAGVPIPLPVAPGVTLPLVLPEPIIGGDTLLRSVEVRDFASDVITARFDLNGGFKTGPAAHTLLASFEYQRVDAFNFNNNSVFDFPPIPLPDGTLSLDLNLLSLSDPVLVSPPPLTLEGGVPNSTDVETFGLIFFDQIDIGDRIHILGGGRLDFVDQTSVFGGVTFLGEVEDTIDEITETAFSPRAGVVVEPFRDTPLSLFFNWSQSFVVNLPGEFDTETVDPQEGRVFEGGVRYQVIPGALELTATGFGIEVENVPTLTVAFATASPSTQSSRGIELTAQGQVGNRLSVLANYAFIDSDAVIFTEAGETPGESIPGVADHVASGLFNYAFQGGLEGLNLGAGVVYQSQRNNAFTAALPNALQPLFGGPPVFLTGSEDLDGFVRLDLTGSYDFRPNFGVSFGVLNVTNAFILQPSTPATTRPDPGVNRFVRISGRF